MQFNCLIQDYENSFLIFRQFFQYLNKNLISWGMDLTGEFSWIEGHWNASLMET